ncbi:glycosyltransferase family 2 protein [Gemmobacter serpentinus]|uniref:glycosyltransferase family 2 protein n=1 Tax=Gemmobacter serpentinus TaxID=2652247 RepID=UPI0018657D69|nr:glycosyltransferase [Gemmobacter serpentinus]
MTARPTVSAPLTVSVIVVSWQRPQDLRRCLTALSQQDHPALELIVVADPAACAQTQAKMQAAGWAGHILENPGGNISLARNLGLARAAGQVVAFIDDDAAAEPTWASRLIAPFAEASVVAATGFVRGRNGFSFQWRASELDHLGQDHPLEVTAPALLAARTDRAIKTQGTNCAFRAETLRAIGGFDPAYRFYLDEADVNMRLVGRGLTAVIPDAQVHHGFAASDRRRADRVPLSLHEIGASSMVFLRRHAPERLWAQGTELLRADQRRRALRLMVEGRIEPRAVEQLLLTLEQGLAEGARRVLTDLPPLPAPQTGFLPLPGTGPRPGRLIAGRIWQARKLEAQARSAVAEGAISTLIRLSPTSLRHHMRFHPDGWWQQTGGLFGPSQRNQPAFRWWRFAERIATEAENWANFRRMNDERRS